MLMLIIIIIIIDFGNCIAWGSDDMSWYMYTFFATFFQSKGTTQGGFFDPVTLEPFFKTDAAKLALNLMKVTTNQIDIEIYINI